MKLIDPNELEKVLRPILTDESCPLHIAAEIDMNLDLMPKVDAVPVRHGYWIKKRYWSEGVGMGESYGYWYACSECGAETKGDYTRCDVNFCSHCGAKMKG